MSIINDISDALQRGKKKEVTKLVQQAIADAEDLAVTDEELKEQIKTQAEAAGFSDVDEYKSAAKMDPEELREVMMSTKVFEFLEGKVTFNKK